MIAVAVTMDGVSYNEHVATLSPALFRESFKAFGGICPGLHGVLFRTDLPGENGWYGLSSLFSRHTFVKFFTVR